ncbi:MAG: hypothetical protein DMG96_39010 [Acidobacteria bacterium]|nr:MAG: hypothetical protein DMG96_39010 [Acidobacteriota bacterium]
MDIFIIWSGPKSYAVASALHGWLPKIVNAFKPWLSSVDINKGARWNSELSAHLEQAKAGIVCLTSANLHADQILFESGALSKQVEPTFVCPLLIGLEPADVREPLSQFQLTRLTKPEVLQLVKTLNKAAVQEGMSERHIDEVFEVWWPKLESEISTLPAEQGKSIQRRSERELLEEIFDLVRSVNRYSQTVLVNNQPVMTTRESVPDIVIRTAKNLDPDISVWRIALEDNTYHFLLTNAKGDKKYTIEIPLIPDTLDIDRIVKTAITGRLRTHIGTDGD